MPETNESSTSETNADAGKSDLFSDLLCVALLRRTDMEHIEIGPCKCGGYGQVLSEEASKDCGGRCHLDPLKDDIEAQSGTIRKQLWSWFNKVAFTRCHKFSTIVIVHTRWHEDDLIGASLEELAND